MWFELALLVVLVALLVLDRRQGSPNLAKVLPVVVVVVALAAAVQVYRVGDSGARAAWGDIPSANDAG